MGNAYTYSYDYENRITSMGLPGPMTETRRYTPAGQLRYRGRSGSSYQMSDSLQYSVEGKVGWVSSVPEFGNHRVFEHVYSGLGHVVATETYDGTTGPLLFSEEWQYNVVAEMQWRRLQDWQGHPQLYDYSYGIIPNQLVEMSSERDQSTSWTVDPDTTRTSYDQAGSVRFTARHAWSGGENEQPSPSMDIPTASFYNGDGKLMVQQQYKYDFNDGKNKGTYEEYWYDALGRRVLKRQRQDSTAICNYSECLSTIERYVWDAGGQLIAEVRRDGGDDLSGLALDSDNGSGDYYGKVLYVHGGGIDQPLAVIRKSHPSENFVLLHPDYRGTYLDGTDASQNRISCAPYTSGCVHIDWPGWYRRTYHDNGERGLSEWFGSLIFDQADATGLMYRRNRYYDPHTARFTQMDPIGVAGGLNLYGYAGGDPVTYSDPFGLRVPDCAVDAAFLLADLNDIRKNGLSLGRGLALAADVVSLALPFVPAIAGVASRGGRSAARASDYVDITRGGSVANRATNVTVDEFGRNLVDAGWVRSVSKDGNAINYTKDGAKYSVYRNAESTQGPTASYYKPGSEQADLKIRLLEEQQ